MLMKRTDLRYILLLAGASLLACTKEKKGIDIALANDITFEELQTGGDFSFRIPDAPFKAGDAKSGVITVNVKKNGDGTFSGFAVSNKNWRSYPWNLSPDFAPPNITPRQVQDGIDSCIFSVYTSRPNHTGNFLVASVKGDDAAITLEKAAVVEHILVANTTYNYLLETYGSVYSGTLNQATQAYMLNGTKVKNIQIANPSTDRYGRFTLPGPQGTSLISLAGQEVLAKRAAGAAAANAARLAGKTEAAAAADSVTAAGNTAQGFVKLTVQGFNGNKPAGIVDFWLAIRPKVDPLLPDYNVILPDWFKVDLSTLGVVDKLIFRLSSSDNDTGGNMRTPPYFCLDGMRIRQ